MKSPDVTVTTRTFPNVRQGWFVNANSLVGAPSDGYAVAVEDGEVGVRCGAVGGNGDHLRHSLGNRQRPRNSPLVGFTLLFVGST